MIDRRGFMAACLAAVAAPKCELPVSASRGFRGCKIDLIFYDEIDAWPGDEVEPMMLARERL